MHITSEAQSLNRPFHRALSIAITGVLLIGLSLLAIGCDSGGGNGGDDGGEEPGLTAPAAPSGLEATAANAEVSLDWEAVSDADAYRVYRSTSSGVDASGSPLEAGLSSASYTDEGVDNGTTYYYVVTAVATDGDEEAASDPSGETAGTPFEAPSNLEGSSGDSQIELAWDEATGAQTYNVYRSTSSGVDTSGDPLEAGVSSASYTDESAENGTKYYYRVTSINPEDEESPTSNEMEKTPFDEPDRP